MTRCVNDCIIDEIFNEMKISASAGRDCWLTRVFKIKEGLGITSQNNLKSHSVTQLFKSKIQSKFEKFWLESINEIKYKDGHNSNKLRFYNLLKGSFKQEPYLNLVKHRNQRCQITRLRISAHQLAIEKLRYSKEYIPPENRKCTYCRLDCQDSEVHFLVHCPSFDIKRRCYWGKLRSTGIELEYLDDQTKVATMLCPTNVKQAKLTNKFIEIMFNCRKRVDEGATIESLNQYTSFEHNDQYSELDNSLNNSLDSNFDDSSSHIFNTND